MELKLLVGLAMSEPKSHPEFLMTKLSVKSPTPAKWAFTARFRSRAYGWRGSDLAAQRLKEAVGEIRRVAKADPLHAGAGAVLLLERLWPALQDIDTSSGRLGRAVYDTTNALIPIIANAPADCPTRAKWLQRLFDAIQEDGVDYLSTVADRWGEIAVYPELLFKYAEDFLPLLNRVWREGRPGEHVKGAPICLSSLLAAGRDDELFSLLAHPRHKIWHYHQFGAEALARKGLPDAAIAYADACRDANSDRRIDGFCERILIADGRSDEAYDRYGIHQGLRSTYLATYRALTDRYPNREPRSILQDLITTHGEPGKWFAAAKDAGFFDLAIDCARSYDADPVTLARASRDFAARQPAFALETGLLAIDGILHGRGRDPTSIDLTMALDAVVAAASAANCSDWAMGQIRRLGSWAAPGREYLQGLLLRRCGPVEQAPGTTH